MATTCEQALNEKSEQLLRAHQQIAEMEKLLNATTKEVRVKIGPAEGEITPGPQGDNWTTVGMLVVTILSIYAGIKLINKLIK